MQIQKILDAIYKELMSSALMCSILHRYPSATKRLVLAGS